VVTRVRLLGPPRIERDGQPCLRPRGQKSWAVLARVALADRPLGRAELSAELFAEADDPLGAVRWCLADLRRCLGDPGLLRGDPLSLPPGSVWLDVWALRDGTLPAGDIGGALIEGVDPRLCPGFETWLLLARGQCAARSMEELRQAALRLMAVGDAEAAAGAAGQAVTMDPLDEGAQELLLRALVAAGHPARATVQLALCEATFAREGLVPSPVLRAAARPAVPRAGIRAGVMAEALLRSGRAALDAGSADAGIETLRRAAEEAGQSGDARLQADVLRSLGGALVHAVRGLDGEGALVLHQALALAPAGSQAMTADILRELAFVDVQAGRHALAQRALTEAAAHAEAAGDPELACGILAIRGMNEADRGRHTAAATLLAESAQGAARAGRRRQEAWSAGVLARSLLLAGDAGQAMTAAEHSISICDRERWNAFLPWPQSVRAHCLMQAGRWDEARRLAEQAFAQACQLGDPCWEGMAGRAMALIAEQAGDHAGASEWVADARRRADRVADRYVWVSAYVALAQLEIAARRAPELVAPLAERLYQDALRADLPEFIAWALVYQAEAGNQASAALGAALAADIANPALQARAAAARAGASGRPDSTA
jgi:DNA-binding SARP family transcriptional activator